MSGLMMPSNLYCQNSSILKDYYKEEDGKRSKRKIQSDIEYEGTVKRTKSTESNEESRAEKYLKGRSDHRKLHVDKHNLEMDLDLKSAQSLRNILKNNLVDVQKAIDVFSEYSGKVFNTKTIKSWRKGSSRLPLIQEFHRLLANLGRTADEVCNKVNSQYEVCMASYEPFEDSGLPSDSSDDTVETLSDIVNETDSEHHHHKTSDESVIIVPESESIDLDIEGNKYAYNSEKNTSCGLGSDKDGCDSVDDDCESGKSLSICKYFYSNDVEGNEGNNATKPCSRLKDCGTDIDKLNNDVKKEPSKICTSSVRKEVRDPCSMEKMTTHCNEVTSVENRIGSSETTDFDSAGSIDLTNYSDDESVADFIFDSESEEGKRQERERCDRVSKIVGRDSMHLDLEKRKQKDILEGQSGNISNEFKEEELSSSADTCCNLENKEAMKDLLHFSSDDDVETNEKKLNALRNNSGDCSGVSSEKGYNVHNNSCKTEERSETTDELASIKCERKENNNNSTEDPREEAKESSAKEARKIYSSDSSVTFFSESEDVMCKFSKTSTFQKEKAEKELPEKCLISCRKQSSESSQKESSETDEDDLQRKEVEKLVNLKCLESKSPKKSPQKVKRHSPTKGRRVTDQVQEDKVRREKDNSKEMKGDGKNSLMDFICVPSDESDDTDETVKWDSGDRKFYVRSMDVLNDSNRRKNEMAKDSLLCSSSSDSGNTSEMESEEEETKNINSPCISKDKRINDEPNVKAEEDNEEEILKRKTKKSWQKDKLLRMAVSDSDSSEDEKKVKKHWAKDHIPKDRHTKKSTWNLDDVVSVSSTDSEDIFVVKKKSWSGSEDRGRRKIIKRKRKTTNTQKHLVDVSSDSDVEIVDISKSQITPSKGRKNIRDVIEDANVTQATLQAANAEKERRKRVAEREKIYSQIYESEETQHDVKVKLVLDFDPVTKEELVVVDKGLVVMLKPHQVKGVKFMWESCFESLQRMKTSKGSGCILAHCMGLGKTFQVVTLLHTVMHNPKINIRKVLILSPLNAALNWVNEFKRWLKLATKNSIVVNVLLKDKRLEDRLCMLEKWHREGGVMIIGYEMFRFLCNKEIKHMNALNNTVKKTLLDPGPDLVICDEGHQLKNAKSLITIAVNRISTMRRIILTGTPLQNNLKEYYCMVQFVKPNLLGNRREFLNRFANPISNGQYENSTYRDVQVMKKRSHVLHKMLEGCVQRYDYSILTSVLPEKFEYAIFVKLTDLQVKMYQYYLVHLAKQCHSVEAKAATATLFRDFLCLRRVSTHPRMLLMDLERKQAQKFRNKSSAKVLDSDSEYSDMEGRKGRLPASQMDDEHLKWWMDFVEGTEMDDIRESGKLVLLFSILTESEKVGDKLLVFSQSLLALNLIEYFLAKMDDACKRNMSNEKLGGFMSTWKLGHDYFRIDGSTSPEEREVRCKKFNQEDNKRARLFLISTRAGGMGINLHAANRVIIFDASWNPSHDVQSIFRVYRFGQTKPCYIYRFLAQHTMEEKVYSRQVTKLSLACRVVDEQQIERHYKFDDLQNMYLFDPDEVRTFKTPMLPKDVILAELLKLKTDQIDSYHEHDSLLENKEEEELNEEERKAAWEEYEREKEGRNFCDFERPRFGLYLRDGEEIIREERQGQDGYSNFGQSIHGNTSFGAVQEGPILNSLSRVNQPAPVATPSGRGRGRGQKGRARRDVQNVGPLVGQPVIPVAPAGVAHINQAVAPMHTMLPYGSHSMRHGGTATTRFAFPNATYRGGQRIQGILPGHPANGIFRGGQQVQGVPRAPYTLVNATHRNGQQIQEVHRVQPTHSGVIRFNPGARQRNGETPRVYNGVIQNKASFGQGNHGVVRDNAGILGSRLQGNLNQEVGLRPNNNRSYGASQRKNFSSTNITPSTRL